MKRCPKCGSGNAHRSTRRSSKRTLRSPLHASYRCHDCRARFRSPDWLRIGIGSALVSGVLLLLWWKPPDPVSGAATTDQGTVASNLPTPMGEPGVREELANDLFLLTDSGVRYAAERGDPEAQYRLGLELLQRHRLEGEPRALGEAVRWLRESAGQAMPRAQLVMGRLYEDGLGVIQDYVQAAGWYEQAARQGEPEGMLRFGQMIENGRGVPRDRVEAYSWLNLSASRGNAMAAISRDRVVRLLQPEEVAKAQELSRTLDLEVPRVAQPFEAAPNGSEKSAVPPE